MQLIINGDICETNALNLADLLLERGYGEPCYATAVNGDLVQAIDRSSRLLAEQDKIEILMPMQGG